MPELVILLIHQCNLFTYFWLCYVFAVAGALSSCGGGREDLCFVVHWFFIVMASPVAKHGL